MSIRLNKALRELNIGLQTAVEYLEKRSDLGEVKAEPSFKLTDEQYAALAGAFQQDKEVRSQAEKLLQKKPKEKKAKEESSEERSLASGVKQQYKPLGKIDLDSIGKKHAERKPAKPEANVDSQAKTAAVSQKPATPNSTPQKPAAADVKVEKTENKINQKPVVQNKEHKKERNQEPKTVDAAQTATTTAAEAAKTQPAETTKSETTLFTTKSEKKILNTPKVNVLGKIDLATLNQSTRPKKKSKEEKRKEREEKAQQQRGDKKKRERINKVRVDINAASNQPGNGNGGKQNNNGNAGGSSKNKKKNRNRGGQQKPAEVSDEDVARQVKETLARLTNKQNQTKKGAKYRKEKREAAQEKMNEERREEKKESKTLKLTEFVTVSELATMMNVSVNQVIGTLMSVGIMVSINQRLDAETINLVAEEFGFKTEYVSAEVQEAITEAEDDENDLVPRAPIVTVMGHVDHGKTSLLDYIRKTNVIAGEAGGITQHIGAYHVQLEDGRKITFLDTPGHEAFTAMRARGTQVTDVAIIIIAADDAVMPTTKEAIAHAQAANVPMVFAINKIDKPGANPDRVRQELTEYGVIPEEWGGQNMFVNISAKQKIGIDDLLETVLLQADVLELKANPDTFASGNVLEAKLDKGRGSVATVLVTRGTLHVGDTLVAGLTYGRVRAMLDPKGRAVTEAGPSDAVEILGLQSVPNAGDEFRVFEDEREARALADERSLKARIEEQSRVKHVTLENLFETIADAEVKELNLIIKADVQGSIEALQDSLDKMDQSEVRINTIHSAVGAINETDVVLADASNAIIIGFGVRPDGKARSAAEREGVEIRCYDVIYKCLEELDAARIGMLKPTEVEVSTGTATVLDTFKVPKVGIAAGVRVEEGEIAATDSVRLVRDGIVVFNGKIASMRHYKDEAKSLKSGSEGGIGLENFQDIKPGDQIEGYRIDQVARTE